MKTLRSWISVILTGVIIAGCAVGPTLIPITDSTRRLEFHGFSILPPTGQNWFIVSPPAQPPNYTLNVFFTKNLREKVTRPADVHRVSAVVRTYSLGNVKFESRIELLQYLASNLEKVLAIAPNLKASLDKCLGWDCVKYEFRYEDRSSPAFPGFVFIITGHGFVFLHTDSSTFIINLEYRQYYLRGQDPLPWETLQKELEPFLRSLAFTSIR